MNVHLSVYQGEMLCACVSCLSTFKNHFAMLINIHWRGDNQKMCYSLYTSCYLTNVCTRLLRSVSGMVDIFLPSFLPTAFLSLLVLCAGHWSGRPFTQPLLHLAALCQWCANYYRDIALECYRSLS